MEEEKKGKHVLIVEDEMSLQEILTDELEHQGFRVSNALDGGKAMQVAMHENPDLILLDLLMPQVDGMTFLTTLRKNIWGKDIPVIILTNVNDVGEVSRAVEHEAYDYLVKANVTVPEIIERIKKRLGMLPEEDGKTAS